MICRNCGAELQDATLLICPHCGQDPASEPVEVSEAQVPVPVPVSRETPRPVIQAISRPKPVQEVRPAARGVSGCTWGIILITLLGCVAIAFAAAGLGGIYQGLKERNVVNQALAYEHYSRGVTHLEADEIDLAEAEFEQAIRLSPSTSMEAYEELKKIRTQRRTEPTPTTSAIVQQAGIDIMAQARVEYDTANWEEAIVKLEQVQSLDADYDQDEVRNMLYTAYFKYGKQLLEEERPEEARRSFESALELKPDDPDARQEISLVTDYLAASSLLGADWEQAISAFTDLYRRNKDYLDVGVKLQSAHQSYGDVLAKQEDWCGAVLEYARSLGFKSDDKVKEAYDETGSKCETGPPPIEPPPAPLTEAAGAPPTEETTAEPTPTAEAPAPQPPAAETPAEEKPAEAVPPPPTEEQPEVEGATTPAEVPPAGGVLAFSSFDPDDIRRVYQIKIGEGSPPDTIAQNASQPAFSHDGTRLAFLSWQGDINGLRVTDLGGRNGYNVTKFMEDGYPSWGPDGTQLALSSTRENDRKPRVYTTWADGLVDSVQLTLGEQPSWSSQGWIAYHGCDETGGNCGIWKMAPNGKGQAPVTNNESDTTPAWSPDGNRIAFMSARDGNWEIYTVNGDGSQPTRLTDNSADDGIPTWSPDGNWIAFVSSRGGLWSLYLVPASGGEPQKLWDVPNIGRDWTQQRLTWR